MRIYKIELFRFKPFLVSEIELLEIEMPNSIQNIIGMNGSGKTSLLRELNPRPAVRTDYGDCGYKRITLMHGNSEYVLTSDFSNLSSPHSFVKDNEELNSSGTTSVQEELIINHLEYTNQIHNISYGTFPLSRMQVGIRKTYLLTAHPCQMKIILDKHKKVNTALRACRDNLVMLQERRASLSSQLIEESVKISLNTEQTNLSNELGNVVEATHRLINQKNNLQKELKDLSFSQDLKSRNEIIFLKPSYVKYRFIPRDIPVDICRNTTSNEISILTTKLESLTSRARELTLEIDKYEQYIKQNDQRGALDSIEATISTLAKDIDELETYQIDNPFDGYLLEKIPEQLSYLTDVISFFIGYNAPIPSKKEVYILKEKIDRAKELKRYVDQDEITLLERLSIHEKTLNATLIENIPKSCCECILFKNYYNTLTSAQAKYNEVDRQLKIVQLKKKRLSLILDGRLTTLSLYEQALPQLQKISEFLSENRYLLIALRELDLLQTLRKNPASIIVKIQNHYNLSLAFYELKTKKETLDKLVLEQEKLKTPSEFGQKFLEQMVIEKHTELEIIRNEYNLHNTNRTEKTNFLNLLNDYEKDLNSVKRDYESLKSLEKYKILEHEIEACDLYINYLNKIKFQIVGRLTEIDRILREQESIMARYHDEIMVNIEKISLQESEYALIEKALSPTTGIAHKYMVQFLNDLFTDANIFMSEIFSYPIEFILLEEDSVLDYKFKMRIADVPIPDISEASEGQMELANFAFNLALSIQREQSQYPLYLDECAKSFDSTHKQKFVEFLKTIVEDGLVSQLFLINHHATISAGLLNSDFIVLNPENIVVPEIYNEHVIMEKY